VFTCPEILTVSTLTIFAARILAQAGTSVGVRLHSWDKWKELQRIHREEERTDNLAREGQERSITERSLLPRKERVGEILEQRTHEPPIQIGIGPTRCGIPRSTRCRRLADSALLP